MKTIQQSFFYTGDNKAVRFSRFGISGELSKEISTHFYFLI